MEEIITQNSENQDVKAEVKEKKNSAKSIIIGVIIAVLILAIIMVCALIALAPTISDLVTQILNYDQYEASYSQDAWQSLSNYSDLFR